MHVRQSLMCTRGRYTHSLAATFALEAPAEVVDDDISSS